MRDSFTFKIGGEAGMGIMTTGLIFSKTCTRSGFNIFNYVEYPSLIRGGHNVMETHFAKGKLYAQEKNIDLLAALNQETINLHKSNIKDGGAVLFDKDQVQVKAEEFPGKKILLVPIPLKNLINSIGGTKIMENNVVLGASIALFNLPLESLFSVIQDVFGGKKGQEIVEINKKSAQVGYDFIKQQAITWEKVSNIQTSPDIQKDKLVITGNEAVGLGAIAGGCQFYAAYPMTPSSAVLHYLASKAKHSGMVVRHAEDEIGVIHEAIGASFAGVRAMIGTSGGGYALMNEAISFAGIAEIGLVVIMGQRPGPATGMPTWTEQGDLQYIIRSGHGEFPKIVLAPADAEESFLLTQKALNLADIYQTPVFVMNDKYIAESHMTINKSELSKLTIVKERGKWEETREIPSGFTNFLRYKLSDDGISPRIRPGTKGFYYQSNSYEHNQEGHTSEDAINRVEQVNKRFLKMKTYLTNHWQLPRWYGSNSADVTLVAWGSLKLPILELFEQEGQTINGKTVNMLHFNHIWPMDGEKVRLELAKAKQLVLIENNATGQFASLLRQETGIHIKKRLLKYDGRPIYPEEIKEFINTL